MMNGLLLALILLLLLPLAGRSQAPARVVRPDSVAAIKRLFRQRRQCGGLGLAVGCGTMAAGVNASATPEGSRMMMPPAAVAGLGTSGSVLSFFSLMRFSRRRELAALRCLVEHRPLPGYVQRSLGPLLASW